eukprot:symbB.v1.2.004999.t1/scaffold288.1/size478366/29
MASALGGLNPGSSLICAAHAPATPILASTLGTNSRVDHFNSLTTVIMGNTGKWSALAFLVLGLWSGIGAELCLDDGVPESERQYIQDNAGNDMPVGFLVCTWQSSELLTVLTSILTEEALGFHTIPHPVKGGNGASPIYALAGCTDFDNASDRGCHGYETKVHVSIDSWVGSYSSARDKFNRQNPRIASVDLGGMGYDGEESIYLRRSVLKAAYEDNGLALNFYLGYNTTYHNPKQYFDSISSVNISELRQCSETQMSNKEAMSDYAQYSGDYDGVAPEGDGYIAKCPDGRWWFSPACRHDTSTCIPTFTAGDGWKLQAMMQWATAYGIPAAIGISDGWSNFVSHVQSFRSLHYWWVPDSTFIDMQPAEVVFPRHSALEWAAGDKKTGGSGSYVSKMVSQNLQSKASKVQRFVAKITFELAEVQDLLLDLTEPNATFRTVACEWIQNNKERWDKWKPVETNCDPGFGMVDAQGSFVANRTGAVNCGLCPAGTASEEVLDDEGRTFQCKLCPPGYSQPNTFSTKCEPCPKGYISDNYGSKECSACGVSEYQPSQGQTACIPCHASRTTSVQGASSLADCICPGGTIEDSNAKCVECSIGLTCPVGSTLQKLNDRNLSSSAQSDYPTVERGFRANPESPLDMYKCAEPFACPGGAPGQCLDARVGLTCGDCPAGQYWGSGACQECGVGVPVAWAAALAAICLGLVVTYYSLTSKYTGKASTMMCTTGALGMLLGTMQNLGVLSTVSVPWWQCEPLRIHCPILLWGNSRFACYWSSDQFHTHYEAQGPCMGEVQDDQLHWAVLAGWIYDHVQCRAAALHVLRASYRRTKHSEVPQRLLRHE